MSELTSALAAGSASLARQVIDTMYVDPFWQARFGERGRMRSEEDIRYHVSYVVEALAADDPEIFVSYARWLRTLLVSRGMCTRHLAVSFDLLADAIEGSVARASAAREVLRRGRDALVYEPGVANDLAALAPSLAADFTAASRVGAEGALAAEEAIVVVDYLADALAVDRGELFDAHVAWTNSRPRGPATRAFLVWLDSRLSGGRGVSPTLADRARVIVASALASSTPSAPGEEGARP